MEHSDFVDKYKSNRINIRINRNKAGYMYSEQGLLPENIRTKQSFIRTIAFIGIPTGIILFFFVSWWIALSVVFLSFYTFSYAQKSAARGVLRASIEDPKVYQIAVQNEVLIIKDLAKQSN